MQHHEFNIAEFLDAFHNYVRVTDEGTVEDERKRFLQEYLKLTAKQIVELCLPSDFAVLASASVGVQVCDDLPEEELVPIDAVNQFVVRRVPKLIVLMRGIVLADSEFATQVYKYLAEARYENEISPRLYDTIMKIRNKNQKQSTK